MTHRGLNRRHVLQGLGAAAGLATTGTFLSVGPSAAADFKIRMQLGWLASNGILGEVMADKLGYFAEEGLELEIIPGGPNIDGVASVASGANNFGSISSSPSLMLARSAGLPGTIRLSRMPSFGLIPRAVASTLLSSSGTMPT